MHVGEIWYCAPRSPQTQPLGAGSARSYPANTRRGTGVGLMLVHRLRCWPNLKTTSVQHLGFTEKGSVLWIKCVSMHDVYHNSMQIFWILRYEILHFLRSKVYDTLKWTIDLGYSIMRGSMRRQWGTNSFWRPKWSILGGHCLTKRVVWMTSYQYSLNFLVMADMSDLLADLGGTHTRFNTK